MSAPRSVTAGHISSVPTVLPCPPGPKNYHLLMCVLNEYTACGRSKQTGKYATKPRRTRAPNGKERIDCYDIRVPPASPRHAITFHCGLYLVWYRLVRASQQILPRVGRYFTFCSQLNHPPRRNCESLSPLSVGERSISLRLGRCSAGHRADGEMPITCANTYIYIGLSHPVANRAVTENLLRRSIIVIIATSSWIVSYVAGVSFLFLPPHLRRICFFVVSCVYLFSFLLLWVGWLEDKRENIDWCKLFLFNISLLHCFRLNTTRKLSLEFMFDWCLQVSRFQLQYAFKSHVAQLQNFTNSLYLISQIWSDFTYELWNDNLPFYLNFKIKQKNP